MVVVVIVAEVVVMAEVEVVLIMMKREIVLLYEVGILKLIANTCLSFSSAYCSVCPTPLLQRTSSKDFLT